MYVCVLFSVFLIQANKNCGRILNKIITELLSIWFELVANCMYFQYWKNKQAKLCYKDHIYILQTKYCLVKSMIAQNKQELNVNRYF